MPAGTATPGHTDRPDLAHVTGTGQLIAHLSARALAMESMHGVKIEGRDDAPPPMLQVPILGEQQPCLQAAAFLRGGKQPSSDGEAVIAVLNICNTTIPITLLLESAAGSGGSATVYDLMDP
eukprot:COSAG05_NODE_14181_length_405_cov_0.830065_1_plen_121_part_01